MQCMAMLSLFYCDNCCMCIKMSHTNYVSHAVCSPREINAFIKHAVKI